AAVGILLREVEAVRGVVGGPRAPLVFTVLGHEQSALQGMVTRREANAVGVTVPPREGLDIVLRIPRVERRSQDGAVAHPGMRRPRVGGDDPSGVLDAKWRVPARLDPTAGVEHIVAELDVLTRDIVLVRAAAVVAADHARLGLGQRATWAPVTAFVEDQGAGSEGIGRREHATE